MTAISLFEFYNISTTSSLTETDFAKIATVIVYSLLPTQKHWSNKLEKLGQDDRFVAQNVAVYEELLARYETNGLCEQIFDQMLRDINDSIGEQLNSSQVSPSNSINLFQYSRHLFVLGVLVMMCQGH